MQSNGQIGLKIHKQRMDKGLSLRALAEKAGLSAAYISQIERGRVAPSLDSLRSLTEALHMPLFSLFISDYELPGGILTKQDPSQKRMDGVAGDEYTPVVRANNRPKLIVPNGDVVYELLSIDAARKMEAFIARLGPDQEYRVRRLRQPTEEIILVLSGVLSIGLKEHAYVLFAGDSIYFDGEQLTSMDCASDQEVVWLSVITPPMF